MFSVVSCSMESKTPPPAPVKPKSPQVTARSVVQTPPPAALPPPLPKSLQDEIVQVLQSKYVDSSALSIKELNQAAAQGILSSLNHSVQLVDTPLAVSGTSDTPSLNSVSVLDSSIGYLRINRIEKKTVSELKESIQDLQSKKKIESLILDLRYTKGTDFSSVANIASLFLPEESQKAPLFVIQRGKSSQKYTATSESLTNVPLVVLINEGTKEAAEVLAAVLQDQRRGMVIGNSPTAGLAFETSDVTLSNGQILRLATGKVNLAHQGSVFLTGTKPDVLISFDKKLEKEIYEKPFQAPLFRPEVRYYSEAILTGRELAPPISKDKNKTNSEPHTNQDLVLIRAIDLLKTINALGLSSTENFLTDGKS
jgi:hypothetical protein